MAYYSPESIEEVQAHIDSYRNLKKVPLELAWDNVLGVWAREGITHTEEVSVDDISCHPANRGKAGINGHKAHKTGADVAKTGCVHKKLDDSMGFEPCPIDPMGRF